MIVVVDTNILFSACITPNSKITEILLSSSSRIERISCHYLLAELFRHQTKLVQLSKQPADKVAIVLYNFFRQMEFFNESIIEKEHWQEADRLTIDVDSDDINFVALALQKSALLWTGDRKLTTHLKAMGFDRVITTGELYEMVV